MQARAMENSPFLAFCICACICLSIALLHKYFSLCLCLHLHRLQEWTRLLRVFIYLFIYFLLGVVNTIWRQTCVQYLTSPVYLQLYTCNVWCNFFFPQKELSSHTQRRKNIENQLATKKKNLETMQNAAPDLEGQSERIKQQIVRINQQRAQLAVEYKDAVRVRAMTLLPLKIVEFILHTQWLVRSSLLKRDKTWPTLQVCHLLPRKGNLS